MKKVISFSLWGEDPKYCVGAVKNAELAAIHYPGWECRFYVGNTDQLPSDSPLRKSLASLFKLPNTDIRLLEDNGSWHGMFWRFEPASEDDVDVFISRDCDSRISAREASAVKEWLASPQLVHSMSDHPYHFHPKHGLMGGMFGMKRYGCPEMVSLINTFKTKYPDAWQCDQDFLREYILPRVAFKLYTTSDIHPGCHPFPIARMSDAFVGEIVGPNDEILYPEHRSIRGSYK